MKILLYKSKNGGVYPAYPSDYENMKRVKAGEYFTAEIVKPRAILLHRKFFALLNLVVDNTDRYSNVNDLRHDLLIEAGYFDSYINFLGEEVKRPHSISFSAMDNYEFDLLYNKCVDTVIQHFCFDRESLQDEISQYF